MTVHVGIAMAGKVFGCNQHSILRIGMRPVDVRGHVLRHVVRILAVRPEIDHRIVGVHVDVGNRREDPVEAQRARFSSGDQTLDARAFHVACRAIRHVVGEARAGIDAHRRAALEITADD